MTRDAMMSAPESDAQYNTILIVDDDVDTVDMINDGISAIGGYRTDTALSGNEALEKVKRNPPDLILLDIMLKDIDGTVVCRAIKGNRKTSHIPVIALTVIRKDAKERYKAIIDAGVDEHISKPFSFMDLETAIERHLKNGSHTVEESSIPLEQDGDGQASGEYFPRDHIRDTLDSELDSQMDALAIDRKVGYLLGEAKDLINIAHILKVKGKYDEALERYMSALELFRTICYKPGEAECLGNIGLINIAQGNLEEALKHHRAALEIEMSLASSEDDEAEKDADEVNKEDGKEN